jgi:hypothetical protein
MMMQEGPEVTKAQQQKELEKDEGFSFSDAIQPARDEAALIYNELAEFFQCSRSTVDNREPVCEQRENAAEENPSEEQFVEKVDAMASEKEHHDSLSDVKETDKSLQEAYVARMSKKFAAPSSDIETLVNSSRALLVDLSTAASQRLKETEESLDEILSPAADEAQSLMQETSAFLEELVEPAVDEAALILEEAGLKQKAPSSAEI